MHDEQAMRGTLTLLLTDCQGHVVQRIQQRNRIVTSGRQMVAHMFAGVQTGTAPKPISHLAVGTGSTSPTDADSALVAQRGDQKAVSKIDYSTFTEGSGTAAVQRVRVTVTALLDFADANDPATPLREAGIFNPDGVMYNRVVFQPVTKTNTFQLTLLWDVIF